MAGRFTVRRPAHRRSWCIRTRITVTATDTIIIAGMGMGTATATAIIITVTKIPLSPQRLVGSHAPVLRKRHGSVYVRRR
jgi:hypothetical protein